MEVSLEGTKTKTLAVFENVVTKERQRKKKKFKTHRFSDDDSSPSESELVVDEEIKEETCKRKKPVRIRLKEETLNIKCAWKDCSEFFCDTEAIFNHLIYHCNHTEGLTCKWNDCPNPNDILSYQMFMRHVTYHGHLAKLVNIGENVLQRNSFPECSLEKKYTVDVPVAKYNCEWEGCESIQLDTYHEFLAHVECHVNGAPSGKEIVSAPFVIPCLWSGCSGNYSTRYKLSDHIRVHTKEKSIACPQCFALFSTKTTFSDHRKRQATSDMRSYQCSQCLKLFSIERLLSDHMRSHINQYKCTLCDMTSTKPSMLAKHYRYRHMNERPFECHICNKTFVTKANLNTHLWTHQDKPFKCDQCDFGCKSKVGLRSHMAKVHGLETATYQCQVCKDFFKRGDYLTIHLIKKHKFHWPSGHCRYRYRKDTDGIHRLQTVRYESLEVTEEMIKSESMQSMKNPSTVTYTVTYDKDSTDMYKLAERPKVEKEDLAMQRPTDQQDQRGRSEDASNIEGRQVIITIEDVDESGKVVKSVQETIYLTIDSSYELNT